MQRTIVGDFREIWRLIAATWHVLIRLPRDLRGPGWACFVVFAIALVVSVTRIEELQRLICVGYPTPEPKTVTYMVVRFIDTYVGGAGMTVFGVTAYAIGRVTKRDALANAALVFAAAGFWSFLITGVGQFVFDDMRPREGGALHWFGLHGHGVSGHASAASLVMGPAYAVFAERMSPFAKRAIGAFFGAWALFIGWSRVYLGMHHTWNVVLGLGLGFTCAYAASVAWERTPSRARE